MNIGKRFRYGFICSIIALATYVYVQPRPMHTLTLPAPTGIFSVGTKSLEFSDSSRTMLRGKDPRRWMIQAYYPSEGNDKTYPYMPETIDNGFVQGTKVLCHAKLNALAIEGHRFPMIIFIPGIGAERQTYTILCEELASQGYVVLSIDEPYVSNYVKFKDGSSVVLAFEDAWKVPRDRDYRYLYYDQAMDGTIKDIEFMLDHLDDSNLNELVSSMDRKRMIIMGHSFGGNVAHTLGFKDSRIKAVVDIDSKITERKIFGRIGVPPNPTGKPVLFIRGMMQYQEDLGDQLTRISNATIWSPNVQHSAFSDQAYFAEKIPGFGYNGFWSELYNWFIKIGPHWSSIDTNLGGQKADDWYKEYRNHVRAWLRENIKGQE
jgi:pimeloyl-ACP methyl ester carboxylesterase